MTDHKAYCTKSQNKVIFVNCQFACYKHCRPSVNTQTPSHENIKKYASLEIPW